MKARETRGRESTFGDRGDAAAVTLKMPLWQSIYGRDRAHAAWFRERLYFVEHLCLVLYQSMLMSRTLPLLLTYLPELLYCHIVDRP